METKINKNGPNFQKVGNKKSTMSQKIGKTKKILMEIKRKHS